MVRVLPSPIATPPAALTASAFTLISSTTAPSAATGSVSAPVTPILIEVSVMPAEASSAWAAPAQQLAASIMERIDRRGAGVRFMDVFLLWPGWSGRLLL